VSAEKIFDFHARLVPQPAARDRMLAVMDEFGIERAAVSAAGVIDLDRLSEQLMVGGYSTVDADNGAVAELCAESAGRLLPFFVGNPHAAPDRYADVAAKYSGLELSPAVHGVPFTDPGNVAFVDIAARHSQPVYTVPIARPGCQAHDLARLAREFGSVTFVLGHCGYIGIDLYSIKAVEDAANIVAETSGCYTGIARIAIERLGASRVLFGTDYPMQHPAAELAKMRSLELGMACWDQVMRQNAVRLLGE
jgi:predicted TIM-barrel fold metal-dependent hydrolase